MTPALFSTRVTRLFGITHPILAGGLMWLSDARYVAGIVNAGGMGFITPRSFDSVGAFRSELHRCRELTQGQPFGVNLTLSSRGQNNELIPRYLAIALGWPMTTRVPCNRWSPLASASAPPIA